MNPRTMTEDDWNEILASIEREECILVLGPGAIQNAKQEALSDLLAERLSQEIDTAVPAEQEKLFFLTDRLMERKGWRKLLGDHVEASFQPEEPHPMYAKMARIPFHFFVSLSPDHLLRDAFEKQGLPHQFAVYNYKENLDFAGVPEREYPVLLNLFGSIENADSMVMTYDSLFDFLFAILSTRRLPQPIKEKIISAYNFVLLGFDFESWYLKILLRLFESHRKEISYANPWRKDRLTPDTRLFFEQKFKVDFVEEDVSQFIDALYDRCDKEGLLRQAAKGAGSVSFYDKVVAYIKQSKLDDAIDLLDKQAMEMQDNNLFTEVVMMSRRYNGLVSNQTKGIVDDKDANLELNRIVEGLFGIAERMKDE